jgi:hypothetical protein
VSGRPVQGGKALRRAHQFPCKRCAADWGRCHTSVEIFITVAKIPPNAQTRAQRSPLSSCQTAITATLKLPNQLAHAVYVPLGLGNVALGLLQALLQPHPVQTILPFQFSRIGLEETPDHIAGGRRALPFRAPQGVAGTQDET